ncbi:MAG TPA: maleylpyruvate isomerase N-terminal domain-containing protein, partial [Micromonosporaceae bacterium]
MSRGHGSRDFWLTGLRADGAALVAAAGQPGALTCRVPSCPDWTVGDLLRHVGAVYRRTRQRAGAANATEPWGSVVITADAPAADDPAVVGWCHTELTELITFL